MTIIYKTGTLFDSTATVLVNPVNCRGVMGKGLAAQFKRRYPKMFAWYRSECRAGNVKIGRVSGWMEDGITILNFPTKDLWGDPSEIEYITAGLQDFIDWAHTYGYPSAAFPKLGCGLGGLEWDEVRPIMELYLAPLPCVCEVYV